jgi:hypothetical protein
MTFINSILKKTDMNNIKLLISLLLFALLGVGCTLDEDVSDPETAIIGAWKEIAQGVDDDHVKTIDSGMYLLFLPTGEFLSFTEYSTNRMEGVYQMDSDLLYYLNIDGVESNVDSFSFINRDKLKLTFFSGATILPTYSIPVVHIYKRIK